MLHKAGDFALVLLLAISLFCVAHLAQADAGDQGEETAKERMDIFFVARSYDGTMWHRRDGTDAKIPADAPDHRTDYAAFLEYVKNMQCPEGEKPKMRKLKDGSEKPHILEGGNCWVSVQNPNTKERHSFMVANDGFHYVDANVYVPAIEAVSGKNYVRKLEYKTAPTTFHQLKRIALAVNQGRRVDTIIDDTGYLYKGSDFAVDFLLRIVDDETRYFLRESSGNWPMALVLLDNYYFGKFGQSAFGRNGIPRAEVPPRAHLSALSQHSLDVSPFTKPERMNVYFVLRSYDSTMWHCADGKDRKIPAGAPNPKTERAAFLEYAQNMRGCPVGPAFRTLKDGTEEPDVLDDGNCWVSIQSPTTKERHSFMVSSDGYHDVRANTYVSAIEDVSGKNYVKKMNFQTVPLTFAQLKEIAARVAGDKQIDIAIDENGSYMYKGSDYAIDLLMEIVDPDTKAKLRESANNWPVSMQLLDNYYFEKHGQSAFLRHGIPRGEVPARAHLSTMSVDSLDVSPLHAAAA